MTEPLRPPVEPIRWVGRWQEGHLSILDQTRLPRNEVRISRRRSADVVDDIRRLAVRGAPLIGVAGAYALVFAGRELLAARPWAGTDEFRSLLRVAAEPIAAARPTAVNLGAAVRRSLDRVGLAGSPEEVCAELLEAARALDQYERAACASIARHGADFLRGKRRLLTHCNAGALVTTGLGTALAPIYLLHDEGEKIHVWVDETRPLLQGLRLTSYELGAAGVPHTVIPDDAAAGLMRRGEVDAVIVGADRVCRNGDVVNKVGTYGLALAAREHEVPFVVAAPVTTLDPATARGDDVEIEERAGDVATYLAPAALPGRLETRAPAFDVTPVGLVAALVTDLGTMERPTAARLNAWMRRAAALQAGEAAGR